jgi:hypothetical protein
MDLARPGSQDIPAAASNARDRNSRTFSRFLAFPFIFTQLRGGERRPAGAASPVTEGVGSQAWPVIH